MQEGLTIVGAKPQHLSGLHDAQLGNTEFTTITNELWNDEASQVDNRFGKGRVIWGKDLAQILEEVKIEPDFQYSSRSGDAPILYTHRKTDDTDIYFISNQRRKQEELTCTFRVNSKQPEFWNPVTGEIIPAKIFDIDGERMRLPVSLSPYGSTFVVFRTSIAKDFVNAIEKDGTTLINCKNIEQAPGLSRMGFENNFTVSFWAKPEMNVLLDPVFHAGSIAQPWTEFFAIYPSDGGKLFGNGHAACGIAVGRNGIAVWENADGTPILVLPAPAAIEGWSSIVLQYNNGIPWVYINGRLVKKGTKSKYQVHPPGDKVLLSEGASYYNGDITAPTWVNRILSEIEIRELAKLRLYPGSDTPDCYTHRAGLLFNSNGRYSLRTKSGKTLTFSVSTIHPELAINGPWKIRLRHDGSEIEAEITQLHSLHHHEDPRIKYFSGTLIYFKEFAYQREASTNKRFFLDLGGVEVIAEVILNGKNLGLLWTRPYETDITSALVSGMNRLEVRVTSLLPNRLIGDEQFPDPDSFEGGGGSGRAGLIEGYIKALPNWYVNGESMPRDKRTTFATWKHYLKTSPLLESGLIGPVSIRERYFKSL